MPLVAEESVSVLTAAVNSAVAIYVCPLQTYTQAITAVTVEPVIVIPSCVFKANETESVLLEVSVSVLIAVPFRLHVYEVMLERTDSSEEQLSEYVYSTA